MASITNQWSNPFDAINGWNTPAVNKDLTAWSPTTSAPQAAPQNPTQPAPTPAPISNVNGVGGNSFYQTNLGSGWNPMQYATDARTQDLTKMFGGTATQTAPTTGTASPFYIPQQNSIDFGNGFVGNAGLTQGLLDMSGGNVDLVKRQLADMAKLSAGSPLGIGTNPSLVGYDPSRSMPSTANNTSPFTGMSTNSFAQKAPQYTSQIQNTTPQAQTQQQTTTNPANGNSNNFMSSFMPLLLLSSLFGGGGGWGNSGGLGSLVSLLRLFGGGQQQQYPQFPSSSFNSYLYPGY